MRYENAWQVQDEITTAVNALEWSIWDLHYDRNADVFRLEVNSHLDDEEQGKLISQMSLSTDYDGLLILCGEWRYYSKKLLSLTKSL